MVFAIAVGTLVVLFASIVALLHLWRTADRARASAREAERKLKSEREAAAAWSARLEETIRALEERVGRLAKWEAVADADDTAAQLLRDANLAIQGLRADADRQLDEARTSATRLRD